MKSYRWQNDTDGIVEDDISATMKAKSTTTDERSVPAYVLALPDPSKAKACNMDGSGPDSDKTGCLVGQHPGGTTDLTPVIYGPVSPIPILEAGARTGKSTDDPRAGMGVGDPGDPMFTLQAGKQHAVMSVNARQDPIVSEDKTQPVDTDGTSQAICFQQNSRSEVRSLGEKTGAVTSEPGAQCQNYIFDPLNGNANSEKSTSLGTNCGGSTGRSIAFTQNQEGDILTGDKAPAMGTNANATGRNTPKIMYDTLEQGGVIHGDAEEAGPVEVLRILREKAGEETFNGWVLGVLATFLPPEILRKGVHGEEFRQPTSAGCGIFGVSCSRKGDMSYWSMLEVWKAGCEGCPPQGWELGEQFSGELGAYLSGLPYKNSPANSFMRCVWDSAEGSRILRKTLSAIQKVRGPSHVQKKSAYAAFAVRRLTVEECESLQGFPRGWTRIPWRRKTSWECPDGPRYRAVGNSMAVPVMRWIGERIQMVSEDKKC